METQNAIINNQSPYPVAAVQPASKTNELARAGYVWFSNHRMLLGFSMMIALTASSIYFNIQLGVLNSDAATWSRWIMPASYSFLDVSLLVLFMCLFAGAIKNFFIWFSAAGWALVLLCLSLFACVSYILAIDETKSSHGSAFEVEQKKSALAEANEQVATAQHAYNTTERYKKRRKNELEEAKEYRDNLIEDIKMLEKATPPALAIFDVLATQIDYKKTPEELKFWARLIFGFAIIITPLILTAVLSDVFGRDPQPISPTNGGPTGGYRSSDIATNGNNSYNWTAPTHAAPVQASNVVDFPQNAAGPVYETERKPEPGWTRDPVAPSRTRKTGLDRDVFKEIENYLINGEGPISENKVRAEYGVNKSQLRDLYYDLQNRGHLVKDGHGKPWRRASQ